MQDLSTLRRSPRPAGLAGGLCAGIASHWGVDPLIVRIMAVVLGLSAGVGVALYLIGWALVPALGSDERPIHRFAPFTRKWSTPAMTIAAVVFGVLIVSLASGIAPMGFGPALIVAAVWYFGFYRKRSAASSTQQPPRGLAAPDQVPITAFEQASEAWRQRVEEVRSNAWSQPPSAPADPVPADPASWDDQSPSTTAGGLLVEQPQPRSAANLSMPVAPDSRTTLSSPLPQAPDSLNFFGTPAPSPASASVDEQASAFFAQPDPAGIYGPANSTTALTKRPDAVVRTRRRRVWLVAAILVGIGLTTLGVLGAAGVAIAPLAYAATVLVGLSIALLASAWTGRPGGLLASVIVAGIATASMLAPPLPQASDLHVSYAKSGQLPALIDHGAGDLEVNLSKLDVTADRTVEVHLKFGEVTVVLPPESEHVVVNWDVKLGGYELPDREGGGIDTSGTYSKAPEGGSPTLTLHVVVDTGSLVVK